MFEVVSKLSLSKGSQIVCIIFCNIVAPFWYLFHFNSSIIKDYSHIQQLLVCLAISIPLTSFFSVLVLSFNPFYAKLSSAENEKTKDDTNPDVLQKKIDWYVFRAITGASFLTGLTFYPACIGKFFFKMDGFDAVTTCVVMFFLIFFLLLAVLVPAENAMKAKEKKINTTTVK